MYKQNNSPKKSTPVKPNIVMDEDSDNQMSKSSTDETDSYGSEDESYKGYVLLPRIMYHGQSMFPLFALPSEMAYGIYYIPLLIGMYDCAGCEHDYALTCSLSSFVEIC